MPGEWESLLPGTFPEHFSICSSFCVAPGHIPRDPEQDWGKSTHCGNIFPSLPFPSHFRSLLFQGDIPCPCPWISHIGRFLVLEQNCPQLLHPCSKPFQKWLRMSCSFHARAGQGPHTPLTWASVSQLVEFLGVHPWCETSEWLGTSGVKPWEGEKSQLSRGAALPAPMSPL